MMTVDGSSSVAKVVVADDDSEVRNALVELLGHLAGLSIVGVASSGSEAAVLCAELEPQCAVIDVMMPGGGEEAVHAIRAASTSTRIAVYTVLDDRRTRERMLAAGAATVIVKGSSVDPGEEILRLWREGCGER